MAKNTEVKITLSMEQEFELMNRYGRRCSREGLVMRAIAEAITPAKGAPVKGEGKKPRTRTSRSSAPLADTTDGATTTSESEASSA